MADAQEIVITLSALDLEAIHECVAEGDVASVADFVQRAVRVLLDDVEIGGEIAAEALGTGETSDELAQALDEIAAIFQRKHG